MHMYVSLSLLLFEYQLCVCSCRPSTYVTGATGGIGRHLVRALAARGATVVCTSRDAHDTDHSDVVAGLSMEAQRRVSFHCVNLASVHSVAQFCAGLDVPAVDLMVANAGVMFTRDDVDAPGTLFEPHWAVNHLGHAALLVLLAPRLRGGRVVFVSSVGHTYAYNGVDYAMHSRRAPHDPVRAYASSKLANVTFAQAVQDRLGATMGLTACSVHPGVADTALWRHVAGTGVAGRALLAVLRAAVMCTPEEGAASVLRTCLAKDVAPGRYHMHGRPIVAVPVALKPGTVDVLWHRTVQALRKYTGAHAAALDAAIAACD